MKSVAIEILLSITKDASNGTDELNELFPDYKFDKMEDFLTRVWNGKPLWP